MGDKMITMDSKYREKHYPKGFLAAMAKASRGNGVALIICGLVVAAIGLGILGLEASFALSGDSNPSDDLGVLIFIGVFGLLFFIPGVLLVWLGIKRCSAGESGWIQKSMKASGYPESTIRDFAEQMLEDGSLIMVLGSSRTQGFLTRDYIFFHNLLNPCVLKIEDIAGAYMVEMSYSVNAGGARINMQDKNIMIVSNHKTSNGSEAKEKTIKQLLDLLTEKNTAIDTEGGNILSEKEYDEKVKALTNGMGIVAN